MVHGIDAAVNGATIRPDLPITHGVLQRNPRSIVEGATNSLLFCKHAIWTGWELATIGSLSGRFVKEIVPSTLSVLRHAVNAISVVSLLMSLYDFVSSLKEIILVLKHTHSALMEKLLPLLRKATIQLLIVVADTAFTIVWLSACGVGGLAAAATVFSPIGLATISTAVSLLIAYRIYNIVQHYRQEASKEANGIDVSLQKQRHEQLKRGALSLVKHLFSAASLILILGHIAAPGLVLATLGLAAASLGIYRATR
ncbi:hypothetical protein JYU14_03520 [Simkania negevensis]|uniref:Uncharacterized protein n=1 Tax=Simkania negevensis TaxID=83561 RepID=A0ABS3ASI2_9BACT|nr:hypothetical protein [Simkania negevensis]